MSNSDCTNEARHFGFVLLDDYSMGEFTSSVESLYLANHFSGRELYRWTIYTLDGKPTESSSGLSIKPSGSLTDIDDLDYLLLCGGSDTNDQVPDEILQPLSALSERTELVIGAIWGASFLMARAGLLVDHRAAIHWEHLPGFKAEFPGIDIIDSLYCVDRGRITCAGGTACIDLMMYLIGLHHGKRLVVEISECLLVERVRESEERQRVPIEQQIGSNQPKLMEVVSLMEANLEEPIGLDDLADYVNLSKRQLERLFKKYLGRAPNRYYLDLRLNKARMLLLQSHKSIVDIAHACGFISAPHFTKCYKERYGIPPREERGKILN